MILHGNSKDVLKTFPDNHFDSMVTDPPYGWKFMGKKWDYEIPGVDLWKETYRVLKPGAFILVACGTRTQHRMAVNIEDAGFEIRDVITWHYGSGFPKSLDVSKAIDKQAGVEREITKLGIVQRNGYGEDWDTGSSSDRPRYDKAATDAAKQWDGWGTSLKPATEFWTLARKPLSEATIAENVLKHGTGGINIDGCRIESQEDNRRNAKGGENGLAGSTTFKIRERKAEDQTIKGRFPANVVFSCDCDGAHEDGCPVGELDKQSGVLKSGGEIKESSLKYGAYEQKTDNKIYGKGLNSATQNVAPYQDTGGASRFFYVAKASKSERNKGLEGFKAEREIGHSLRDRCKVCGGRILQSDRPSVCKCENPERGNTMVTGNFHPTVKPVNLMRYLCRLITPPKGLILDPFSGSGSTGIAAGLEWFEFVGIELDSDHVDISKLRQPPPDLFT